MNKFVLAIKTGVIAGVIFFSSASVVDGITLQIGPQKQINSTVSWNQSYINGDCSTVEDKCLLVWRDKRNDPGNEDDNILPDGLGFYGANSNADVYGLFVKGDGTPMGSDFLISTEPAPSVRKVDQAYPEVVYNPTHDEFFVAWQEAKTTATSPSYGEFCSQGGYDIYAQRIAPTRQLLGSRIAVSTGPECQWKPRIAYDSFQDIYLLTWHDHRYRYSTYKEIFGQFVRGDGGLIGGNFLVTYASANDRTVGASCYQEYSAVTFNPVKKEFFVVWADDRQSTAGCSTPFQHDIWGQRLFYQNGVQYVGTNFLIYRNAGIQNMPEVAFNPTTNGYFVVWHNYEDAVPPNAPLGVKISGDGALEGNIITIDNSSLRYYAFPYAKTEEGSGNYLIAWERGETALQAFSKDGVPISNRQSFNGWAYIRPTLIFNKGRGDYLFLYSTRINGYDRTFYYNVRMSNPGVTPSVTPSVTPRLTATPSPTPVATLTPTATLTPVPTGTMTPSPVQTVTPSVTGTITLTPTPSICSCPAGKPSKSMGNANCDETINEADFDLWLEQFHSSPSQTNSADFNCDGNVDGIDFEYWRRGR